MKQCYSLVKQVKPLQMSIQKQNHTRVSRSVGLKIRSLREKRGWTLEETEEHGWHSWQQLQKIEAGRNITIKTLVRVANMLDVHPSMLFEDI